MTRPNERIDKAFKRWASNRLRRTSGAIKRATARWERRRAKRDPEDAPKKRGYSGWVL